MNKEIKDKTLGLGSHRRSPANQDTQDIAAAGRLGLQIQTTVRDNRKTRGDVREEICLCKREGGKIGDYVGYRLAVLVFLTKVLSGMEKMSGSSEQNTAGANKCDDRYRSFGH